MVLVALAEIRAHVAAKQQSEESEEQ